MNNQEGWLYVGDGWLRYRDPDGWTDEYLSAELVRGKDWPPPPPEARSAGVAAGTAALPPEAPSPRVRGRWHLGRPRTRA